MVVLITTNALTNKNAERKRTKHLPLLIFDDTRLNTFARFTHVAGGQVVMESLFQITRNHNNNRRGVVIRRMTGVRAIAPLMYYVHIHSVCVQTALAEQPYHISRVSDRSSDGSKIGRF